MIWLKSLGVAFLGGALTALADALANGASFDPAGLKHIGSVALAGGVVAVAAYLRQSPITPKP